jgi:polysaccharide pyruvyl transferase WcaK-like protein
MIGVTGYYGYGNVGDDILLCNLINFFGTRNVVVYAPAEKAAENLRAQFDCLVSTTQSLPKDSEQLDLLVFGGGGVLHDSAMLNLWPKRIIEQVKCHISLLGLGIPHGEKLALATHKIDYIVDKASFVGLRDFKSIAIFKQLWKKPCFLFPDIALLTERLEVQRSDNLLLQFKGVSSDFRHLSPRNFDSIAKRQLKILKGKMFPWKTANCEGALKAVASAGACVGVSMHFGLLALTQHTPFKMLQYQGKVQSVLGLVVDDSRIIYPSKVYNPEELLPIPDFSKNELGRFVLIKDFLKNCLRRIKTYEFDEMPDYPLAIPQISTRFKYGGVKLKPKFLRNLRKAVFRALGSFRIA